MTPIGQALSDLRQAERHADSNGRNVRAAKERLQRAVDEAVKDIEKAGYRVSVSRH